MLVNSMIAAKLEHRKTQILSFCGLSLSEPELHDFDEMLKQAMDGDPSAQGLVAYAYFAGEGVAEDKEAARYWLLKAVAGEDPWALTTYAIELRASKDPAGLAESSRLLEIAARKGDALGHFTLGLHLFEGIGIEKNLHRATAELLMASFAGSSDAENAFNRIRASIPAEDWPLVFAQVRWPLLTFIMGPLTYGHLEGLTQNRLEDNGDESAPWFQYEREVADGLFITSSGQNSMLATLFGGPVNISSIFVGRAIISGQPVAATTISFGNILGANGLPPLRRPDDAALAAASDAVAFSAGRKWVRWMYQSK